MPRGDLLVWSGGGDAPGEDVEDAGLAKDEADRTFSRGFEVLGFGGPQGAGPGECLVPHGGESRVIAAWWPCSGRLGWHP